MSYNHVHYNVTYNTWLETRDNTFSYIACQEDRNITAGYPLEYCTEMRPLQLKDLPDTLEVLHGQDVSLECELEEESGIPGEVNIVLLRWWRSVGIVYT